MATDSEQKVEVFGSLFSQPSRAVLWLCKLLNTPHEFKPVQLSKGEHRTAEYKDICYFQKVPAIRCGSYRLTESSAIVGFLARRFGKGTSWCPEEDEVAGRVSEFLAWYGGPNGMQKSGVSWVLPAVFLDTRDEPRIANGKAAYLQALGVLEEFFLARDTPFLAACHQTVADLIAACDLSQIVMIDDSDFSLAAFPKVKAWFDTMRSQPHYATVHETIMTRQKINF